MAKRRSRQKFQGRGRHRSVTQRQAEEAASQSKSKTKDITVGTAAQHLVALTAQGRALHEAGKLQEAEVVYESILDADPKHHNALTSLGMINFQRGNLKEAVRLFGLSLESNPKQPAAFNGHGVALRFLRRHEEALASFDRALAIKADFAEAHYNRGIALQQLKRYEEALASFDRALAINPDYAEAYNDRGNVLSSLQRHEEALSSFDRALAIKADFVEAHNNRGIALMDLRRYEDALASYDRVLAIKADFAEVHYNRGIALSNLQRYEEALASYEKALAIKVDFAAAHNNRGNALKELQRYEQAIASFDRALAIKVDYAEAYNNRGNTLMNLQRYEEAIASFDRALELKDDYPQAFNNRGNVLLRLKRYDEALVSYEKVIAIKPDYAEAHYNRGIALMDLRRYEDALASYDRALAIKPDYAAAHHSRGNALRQLKQHEEALSSFERSIALDPHQDYILGSRLHLQMRICSWDNLEQRSKEVVDAIAHGINASHAWYTLAIPCTSKILRACAESYVAESFLPAPRVERRRRSCTDNRIRLGYFSSTLHDHASAYLAAELFEKHDRSRFEVIAFSFGPDSQSDMRRRLTEGFDKFFEVANQSDQAIVDLARELEIDIAVDLRGFTKDSRTGIFALRAAPIQISFLGFPATMGADFIDYIIADEVVIPEEDLDAYAEKVVFLPNSYQPNDGKREIATRVPARHEAGLPETGFVFCSFNNSYKITPDVFDIWMRLLSKFEGSVLWLLEDNSVSRSNLEREAENRGVAATRLVFASRIGLADHLSRHRLADLFLDTFYYNAHTTASDALWAGLPLLTCLGNTFAGRVAASLVRSAGVPELITHSHEAYERLALRLAADSARLSSIRQKLEANRASCPLFDCDLFAQHIETAYRTIWDKHQRGEAPGHITVADL